MYQISANLVHRELRNAIFEGKKMATSITFPDSVHFSLSPWQPVSAPRWPCPSPRAGPGDASGPRSAPPAVAHAAHRSSENYDIGDGSARKEGSERGISNGVVQGYISETQVSP